MSVSESNGRKLLNAIISSVSGRYVVYAVQLLSLMIMARIFTPEQLGFFAILQVFSIFFMLFSEMGFAPALINKEKLPKNHRDGIYSFTWVMGAVVTLLFALSGPLIAWFYSEPVYQLLILPVAISILFNTACIVPTAALQKDRRFLILARADSISELVSLFAVILIALYFDPLWALSLKALIVSVFRFYQYWLSSSNTAFGKPSFGKELHHFKSLLSFSSYQFGFNILNYFSRNLDTILVGKYMGTASLGVYDQAYKLMRYPLLLLTFAMTPAIQPVLTTLKDNKKEFGRLHNKFALYMAYIGSLIGVLVFFLAEFIVSLMLGKQWSAVVPVIEVLSITIPIQTLLSSSGGFYQAAGRADLLFKCGVFSSITNVSAIAFGIYSESLETLCWMLVASFSINFVQCYWLLSRHLLDGGRSKLVLNLMPIVITVLALSLVKVYVY
ncbi:hypothetical protein N473_05625 [Pseudoalteromonas luteoviolacea CPMOR-1]|uniref:Polysaccharide biosynthesis protein C-terminal domain-containing protein n=1 Tax=Pseudoalteromonas luteoviolacea CPMOR-1 TaxID=1365248 RepID=A0A167HK46_9GAMM|nr:lipopolysaccharide biosynthesis protein [Pseudoalteromonas luteoviolacea]KZN58220.1 hypothetical protein N473_05625 [Pseudoalteromonas luteoviolacea CPMOR-1]